MKPDGRTQMGPAFVDSEDSSDGYVDFQQFFFSDPFFESQIQTKDQPLYWSGADVNTFIADIPGGYGSAFADFADDDENDGRVADDEHDEDDDADDDDGVDDDNDIDEKMNSRTRIVNGVHVLFHDGDCDTLSKGTFNLN